MTSEAIRQLIEKWRRDYERGEGGDCVDCADELEAALQAGGDSAPPDADDLLSVALAIEKGVYSLSQVTPNMKALAKDYVRLRRLQKWAPVQEPKEQP